MMQRITGTTNFQIAEPTAVVLGKFDGVHIGHRLLVAKLLEQKEKGLKTVVFTFDKSPASLFIHDTEGYRELCTLEEKRAIFEELGVDVLIEFPMNKETAAIPAEEFVTEMLQKELNCKMLIAGEDITFGYKGLGDSRLLEAYSSKCDYKVEILKKILVRDIIKEEDSEEEVSSTGIRKDINAGKIARANILMERAFQVTGEVVHGNQLGSTVLDMPTANIKWPENKVFPAFGVYFTCVTAGTKQYPAITNVGRKPTVSGDLGEVLAETYLYDFRGDLYGQEISVSFYEYVRPENRFKSLDALKMQLKQDLQKGREYWSVRFSAI